MPSLVSLFGRRNQNSPTDCIHGWAAGGAAGNNQVFHSARLDLPASVSPSDLSFLLSFSGNSIPSLNQCQTREKQEPPSRTREKVFLRLWGLFEWEQKQVWNHIFPLNSKFEGNFIVRHPTVRGSEVIWHLSRSFMPQKHVSGHADPFNKSPPPSQVCRFKRS